MLNPFDRSTRTAPSHYPRVPFHALRCAQLISSLIVGAIMLYFIWHLTHDHWPTPWTFIWLTAASLFSIAALAFTIVLHCCIGLSPKLNIAINGFLSLLWVLSWSLLTYYMSHTLNNVCDIKNWHEETGIMICRIYKALFSFTLIGMVSTFAALCLDVYVHRHQTRRGVYKLHDLDSKRHRPEATRGPFTDEEDQTHHMGVPRESEAWEAPRPSIGPYNEQGAEGGIAFGGAGSGDRHTQQGGYAVPEDQFSYDTGYHGGHSDRAYGS